MRQEPRTGSRRNWKKQEGPQFLQRERGPAHTWISDFWPPDGEMIGFCCVKHPSPHPLCRRIHCRVLCKFLTHKIMKFDKRVVSSH